MADGIDASGWQYRYQLIDMHSLDCERFIHEDNPDALVLAILCDFKGRNQREVVEGIIRRLIELIGKRPDELRNYLKMLETLSTNRRLERVFREVEKKMLSEIDVEKLPSYQLGMDFGIEQGIERGIERGIEQGIEQGIDRGIGTVARNALNQGMPKEQVALLTGLSLEKIEELAKELLKESLG